MCTQHLQEVFHHGEDVEKQQREVEMLKGANERLKGELKSAIEQAQVSKLSALLSCSHLRIVTISQ